MCVYIELIIIHKYHIHLIQGPLNVMINVVILVLLIKIDQKQYLKEGFVANGRINDSTTIVFRGRDKKNRMILLVLTAPKDKNSFLLRLSYMLDFENPDILTITIKDDDF